jgi:hypothetical protein
LPSAWFQPTAGRDAESGLALLLLIIVQAASAAPLESTASAAAPRCEADRPVHEEIVVCAQRQEGSSPYRINQPPARKRGVPKAEVQLADGVAASAETEQADVGGFPSDRVMVRLKIKF